MRLRIFVLLLLAASLAPITCAADVLRESFDLQVPAPPLPVREDGALRLVYELHLTNFSREPLQPMRVDVRDASRGGVLATFDGDALAQRLAQPGATADNGNSAVIASGRRGVLYLELTLPANTPPRTLDHRIDYVAGAGTRAEVAGARTPVSDAAPPHLGAPLRGGPWAAIHSPAWPRGHRRMLYTIDGRARIPGRFAIDWVRLDANGRSTRGDADRTANALGYGAEVLAVADARVAAVRDDMPESATVSAHPKQALGDATGNYVALDLGDGHYAFYEHLKPGSVRVARGQRVRRGETIATLGFTGDSTGPHLHFHIADAASPLGAEGVPFVFERFDVLGRYEDIGKLGDAPWDSLADGVPVRRTAERPAPNVVVDFGE